MAGVAAIGARQRFVPQHASLNYSHPLAVGLVFCAVPALGFELAKNRFANNVSAVRTASMFGATNRLTWLNSATTDLEFTSGEHTLGVAATFDATGINILRMFQRNSTQNTGWDVAGEANTSKFSYDLYRNNAAGSYELVATTAVFHGVFVACSDAVTKRIYLNGAQDVSSTSGNLQPLSSIGDLIVNQADRCRASVACAWGRCLSPGEVAMFTDDPFCMLSF